MVTRNKKPKRVKRKTRKIIDPIKKKLKGLKKFSNFIPIYFQEDITGILK